MQRFAVPVLAGLAAIGAIVATRAAIRDGEHAFACFYAALVLVLVLGIATCGASSVLFLKRRDPRGDDIALAAAQVALAFGGAALIAGAIRARSTIGTWWGLDRWSAISLMSWLVTLAYSIVRRLAGTAADRLAAGLAVFGVAGLPFVYMMIDHGDQTPSLEVSGLAGDSSVALAATLVTLTCWFVLLVAGRAAIARGDRHVVELREAAIDAGLLADGTGLDGGVTGARAAPGPRVPPHAR